MMKWKKNLASSHWLELLRIAYCTCSFYGRRKKDQSQSLHLQFQIWKCKKVKNIFSALSPILFLNHRNKQKKWSSISLRLLEKSIGGKNLWNDNIRLNKIRKTIASSFHQEKTKSIHPWIMRTQYFNFPQ